MSSTPDFAEAEQVRVLLPLAQVYRRAVNAKSARDRHDAAYYLWEAALKLLGAMAVVAEAEQPHADPALAERLQNLARPSVGHWWEFVGLLAPSAALRPNEPRSQGCAGSGPLRPPPPLGCRPVRHAGVACGCNLREQRNTASPCGHPRRSSSVTPRPHDRFRTGGAGGRCRLNPGTGQPR
jgi:hypothetical protein